MKSYCLRALSALLAVIMLVCVFGAVGFSAEETAADTDAEAVIASEPATDEIGADIAQVAATEPSEAPTEVPTEAPTAAPTEAPTEAPPVVGAVRNIDRTSFNSNSATLTWDAVEGATGYYIYYLNADRHKNFSKVADVKTNSCTVKSLRQGTQYHFRISAYIEKDGKIYEGAYTLKKTATQPAKVTGMTKWRSSNVLELEWDRNENATGYRIYRTSYDSDYKEILYKTVYGNSKTTFDDYSVTQGRTYKYRVKAFRELYGTSYSSDAATEYFIAGLCGPDYTIVSRCKRVNLTWNRNPYATHYEVYFSDSPNNSSFTKIFTTPRLYYNTTQLTVGKTYYFRIRPIYQSGSTYITGTSNKKSAKVTASAYGYSTGSTYIEISIDQQHMWFYKNGERLVTTDVVTGNYGSNDTPKGYFDIYSKDTDTNLYGADYVSHVDYWMPFYGGYGIHDSSWRSEYGGSIYKGDGSHGCVNTPLSQVSRIYYNAPVGTPVIIY